MVNQSDKIRDYIIQSVDNHPHDLVSFLARKFNVTRTTIHRHINAMVKNGSLIKSGITSNISYYRCEQLNQTHHYNIHPGLSEFDAYQNNFESIFDKLNQNVKDILIYGFTEIFNNAIDHSKGRIITASSRFDTNNIILSIEDDGIGIFKKIAAFLHLEDLRESLLQLTKGKLTTDPVNHTGEGLFFCARAFDVFEIFANGLHYYRDNRINDWGIESCAFNQKGTKVSMSISSLSGSTLVELFQYYQEPDSLAFTRTEILVELARLGQEILISRSQAKRILLGLDKFTHVILDFSRIRLVGQGFVDEIFRVFANANPGIHFEVLNANDDVKFMISRSAP